MKRWLITSVVLVAIVALPLSHLLMAHRDPKVTICHKASSAVGPGHVINVSHHAMGKHLQNHFLDCFPPDAVATDGRSCLCFLPEPPDNTCPTCRR